VPQQHLLGDEKFLDRLTEMTPVGIGREQCSSFAGGDSRLLPTASMMADILDKLESNLAALEDATKRKVLETRWMEAKLKADGAANQSMGERLKAALEQVRTMETARDAVRTVCTYCINVFCVYACAGKVKGDFRHLDRMLWFSRMYAG
jgi:hypothetical protein